MLLTEGSRHIAIIRHLHLALLGFLGGDDDNTIGTLRTVDGCRRGILQDVDSLNIVGVQVAHRATLYTVNDNQRGVVTIDRAVTTNAQLRAVHIQTGDTSLQ